MPHTSSKNCISYQKGILTSPAATSSVLGGALGAAEGAALPPSAVIPGEGLVCAPKQACKTQLGSGALSRVDFSEG